MTNYRAVVRDLYYFESSKKGTPGLAVMFDVQYDLAEPTVLVKKDLRANMWLSDAAIPYTLDGIRDVFGYIGELGDFLANDANWRNVEADIAVDIEDYTSDDGKVHRREVVKFINRPGDAAYTNDKVETAEAIKKLAKLRGKVAAWQQQLAQSGASVPCPAPVKKIAETKAAKQQAAQVADSDLPF